MAAPPFFIFPSPPSSFFSIYIFFLFIWLAQWVRSILRSQFHIQAARGKQLRRQSDGASLGEVVFGQGLLEGACVRYTFGGWLIFSPPLKYWCTAFDKVVGLWLFISVVLAAIFRWLNSWYYCLEIAAYNLGWTIDGGHSLVVISLHSERRFCWPGFALVLSPVGVRRIPISLRS